MNLVIDKFVEVLSMQPEPVLSSSNVGAKKPSNGGEVPAIVISLTIDDLKGNGIGRFIHAGDSVVQNTAVIEVRSTPETFSNDLRSLRIQPLPLKKNPSSVERKFTESDVRISNVTDPTQPIDYRIVSQPSQKKEYKLDVPQAQIVFGKAQTAGEKLEVVHWTVTWRDEILGDRYSGSMMLEIWANSFNEVDGISRRLQNKVKSNRVELRQRGFMKFQPASLEPVENIRHDPPLGSPFSVWKQRLGYKFAFEAEEGGELSSGIPIKRIDVDMDEHLVEAFSVP